MPRNKLTKSHKYAPITVGEGKIPKIVLETWIVMLKHNSLSYLHQIKNQERNFLCLSLAAEAIHRVMGDRAC